MKNKHLSPFIPIVIGLSICIGIFIGFIYSHSASSNGAHFPAGYSKINALLQLIEKRYVDTVNMNTMIEEAFPTLLSELDPHSVYIPAKDLQRVNDELDGSFSGIGIQFSIQKDTIHVNKVIPGGPSEKVGLIAGDRIVSVNDTAFVGKKVSISSAPKKLKGPKGSEVKLGIVRRGEKEILHFTLIRDDIPVHSVDATLMLTPQWGYIKVNRFGATTYSELLTSIARLKQQNSKGLVIDLRSNSGGYMQSAILMANEFLQKGDLIVYTKGRAWSQKNVYADGTGNCKDVPLIVLIDESSASASEIFAGAIQDNDRGTIIGRRSFGKGLVQEPIEFKDHSAIRLTVARYYTPSGRCIQKPYKDGKDKAYENDLLSRFEHGEFFSKDSIKQNTKEIYYTTTGRKVYGGGGIMPDIFVPEDTTNITPYYRTIAARRLPISFAFEYTDKNRDVLKKYTNVDDLYRYLKQKQITHSFINYCTQKGVKKRNKQIYKSQYLIERFVCGSIIYDVLGLESYVAFLNNDDDTVKKAIKVLNEGKSKPANLETPNIEEK